MPVRSACRLEYTPRRSFRRTGVLIQQVHHGSIRSRSACADSRLAWLTLPIHRRLRGIALRDLDPLNRMNRCFSSSTSCSSPRPGTEDPEQIAPESQFCGTSLWHPTIFRHTSPRHPSRTWSLQRAGFRRRMTRGRPWCQGYRTLPSVIEAARGGCGVCGRYPAARTGLSLTEAARRRRGGLSRLLSSAIEACLGLPSGAPMILWEHSCARPYS
jgi:hypothetical protein